MTEAEYKTLLGDVSAVVGELIQKISFASQFGGARPDMVQIWSKKALDLVLDRVNVKVVADPES